MCCDSRVCASCAGVVADAGCSTCRAVRAELHPTAGLSPQLVLLLAAVLTVLLLTTAIPR